MARGRTRAELDTDRLLNLSLVWLLEIFGEAAGRVSAEERVRHPGIPWAEMVGLRNRLIQGYDSVDFDILWQIVSDNLTPLITALFQITRWVSRGLATTQLSKEARENPPATYSANCSG